MTRIRLSLEPLGARALPSASFANGVLTVTGTEANDAIVVRQVGDRVSVRGESIEVNGAPVAFLSASEVERIEVNALGGDDVIRLGTVRANTLVAAGAGDDWVFGGLGDDWVTGGAGNDRLTGGRGRDDLGGEAGDDSLFGGADDDVLRGGAGADRGRGGAGNDDLAGDDGNDDLGGGLGDDSVLGGAGDDRCSGESGRDALFGESGDDSLSGGADDDLLRGDAGDDRVNGNFGRDDCQGGTGDDDVRNDDGDGRRARTEVEGTITAIDLAASQVTIRTAVGQDVVVIVSAATTLERDDLHVPLSAFQVGDPAEARFDAQGLTLKLEAGADGDEGGGGTGEQTRVEGTITAVDLAAATVTVRTRSGQDVVVSVAPATKVERNDLEPTLAAFQVGDFGEARFDAAGATLKIEAVGL